MKNKIERLLNGSILYIVRNGFVYISGLTIVSSIFTLLANFPIESINNYFQECLGDIFTILLPAISNAFYFFISIYTVISISYNASKYYKIPEFFGTLTTLMAYLCFIPVQKIDNVYYLCVDYVNSRGIFLSIFLGIGIPYILKKIYQTNITIKLPKNVPDDVSKSFESIIPSLIIIFFCFGCNAILYLIGIKNVPDAIYNLFQLPIMGLGNNLISIMVMNLGIPLLWFTGFNGTYVFNTVMSPILATLSMENLTVFTNGGLPPNIITSTFQAIYISIGGSGATLALVLNLLCFSNNTSLRKIAKISLIPSIFNINESVIYGLPIVMNPILFFPFVISPVINVLISYFSMYFGLVNYTNGIQIPWTMPIFISGFLASGISGLILQCVLLIIDMIIYMPFVYKLEKQRSTINIKEKQNSI